MRPGQIRPGNRPCANSLSKTGLRDELRAVPRFTTQELPSASHNLVCQTANSLAALEKPECDRSRSIRVHRSARGSTGGHFTQL